MDKIMKICLISDVHGNLPALNAVLNEIDSIDPILHTGDVVGYNPYPKEVIYVFNEYEIYSIKGNHDRVVTGKSSFNKGSIAQRAAIWTKLELSAEDIEYLDSLPTEETFF